jgi:hypothetical protein
MPVATAIAGPPTRLKALDAMLNAHALYVSDKDPQASYRSISTAVQNASEGDQIIVGPGHYSPATTGECFPIYIPPRCQLLGAGAQVCSLDGGADASALRISVRPLDPWQSLILMGDETVVSGFTLQNSGANAIANEYAARVLIQDNIIRQNGQHGMLVFATNNALIYQNSFQDNGTRQQSFMLPRPILGRQGHHVFIEGRTGVTNSVSILGNSMKRTYADAVAIDIFDQPTGVCMRVQVVGNHISGSERNGFSIASSFGPGNSYVFFDIRKNKIIDNAGNGIDARGAFSLVNRTALSPTLYMNVVNNVISGCDCGINALGAFSPSLGARLACNLIGNHISHTKRYGIRVVSGVGVDGFGVEDSKIEAVIVANTLDEVTIGKIPLLIQGASIMDREVAKANTVSAHFFDNVVSASRIIINDGVPTNSVQIAGGSQAFTRVDDVMTYELP